MRICLNHLTRMTHPRICVAGVDLETRRHVRPITGKAHTMTRDMLAENGGPFEIGAVVELGSVRPNPQPPEVEDHWFWPDQAQRVGRLSADEYLELMDEIAYDDLEAVLGSALQRHGWKYAVDAGTGTASLGVLRASAMRIEVNDYGSLQVRLDDVEPRAYISITDLRYYDSDQDAVREDAVEDTNRRLRRSADAFLMLGLARAWTKPGDDTERHWLQVNGVCLSDDPYEP